MPYFLISESANGKEPEKCEDAFRVMPTFVRKLTDIHNKIVEELLKNFQAIDSQRIEHYKRENYIQDFYQV